MIRSFLIPVILAGFLLLFQAAVPEGQTTGTVAGAPEIVRIELATVPSFGTEGEMGGHVRAIEPDDTLIALLYEYDFFGMPEYFETDVMDGHFTWITVFLRNGESKRVGGLVAEVYGPEEFIALYEALDRAMGEMHTEI